jgi:hypothetical protein
MITCYSSHLTQFGVEEYTDNSLNMVVIIEEDDGQDLDRGSYPAFSCWAAYMTIVLGVANFILMLWGYRKDERDNVNYISLK